MVISGFLVKLREPLEDYFLERWVHDRSAVVSLYNYWWGTSVAMGCMSGLLSRHVFLNPDVYAKLSAPMQPLYAVFRGGS